MADKQHVVTATLIVAKVPGADGGEVYLRKGAHLPAAVVPIEVRRLVELGLVAAVEPEEVAVPVLLTAPASPTGPTAEEVAAAAAAEAETAKAAEAQAAAAKAAPAKAPAKTATK